MIPVRNHEGRVTIFVVSQIDDKIKLWTAKNKIFVKFNFE